MMRMKIQLFWPDLVFNFLFFKILEFFFYLVLFSFIWNMIKAIVSSPSKQCLEAFSNRAIQVHNELRLKHGSSELSLDQGAQDFALEWANHLSEGFELNHSRNRKYGENLYLKMVQFPLNFTSNECECKYNCWMITLFELIFSFL